MNQPRSTPATPPAQHRSKNPATGPATSDEPPERASRPTVSVVIKALNEEVHITGCLRSALDAVRAVGGEVILADSRSTDRTVDIAKEFPITIVQIVDESDRRCGVGWQLGFQYARGEFVYLLDGDMELDPDFLTQALTAIRADPTLAGIGGLITELGGGSYEFEQRKRVQHSWGGAGEQRRLVMGGLYRRDALEATGYCCNRNLHGSEELELGLRLADAGWRLRRIPAPAITHHGHEMGTFELLRKRWRAGNADGPGELLRSLVGKPRFGEVLWEHKHLLATVAGWLWLLAAVLLLPFTIVPLVVWVAIGALVVAAMSIKKRSVEAGVLAVISWQVYAATFVRGCLRPQVDPRTPVPAVVVQSQEEWQR